MYIDVESIADDFSDRLNTESDEDQLDIEDELSLILSEGSETEVSMLRQVIHTLTGKSLDCYIYSNR
jgi:hypothetical protein